jgi:hypothetical protein
MTYIVNWSFPVAFEPSVVTPAERHAGSQTAKDERYREKLAPRARFELATLRLTADEVQNLSALSGVTYKKLGAILPRLVAPKAAPKP